MDHRDPIKPVKDKSPPPQADGVKVSACAGTYVRRAIMYRKLIKKIISYTLIFTFLFSSVLIPLGEATPQNRHQPKQDAPGMVVDRLPSGYRDVWVGKNRYFHHDGVFYRRGSTGFIVIAPPRSAPWF